MWVLALSGSDPACAGLLKLALTENSIASHRHVRCFRAATAIHLWRPRVPPIASIRSDSCLADDFREFRDFRVDERGEFLRRRGFGHHGVRREPLAKFSAREYRHECGMQLLYDRLRQT